MLIEFIRAWDANKKKLENYFRTHEQDRYDSYETLVKLLFNIVINPFIESDYNRFNTDITVLDHGGYQGTQIFILHRYCCQPSVTDYVYTSVYYGSCPGCDTLSGISAYNDGLPDEEQIKDYMSLCLHLLQRCSYLKDEEV